jgi:hypothetical protein
MLRTILYDWCCPRRALRFGDVLGYRDHLTRPAPLWWWDAHSLDHVWIEAALLGVEPTTTVTINGHEVAATVHRGRWSS